MKLQAPGDTPFSGNRKVDNIRGFLCSSALAMEKVAVLDGTCVVKLQQYSF
jgi:hypothetical protein